MQKLAYIITTLNAAEAAVDALKKSGVPDSHLSVIAKDSIDLTHLPEANIEVKSDIIPAAKRGTAIGGVTGVLAGLAVTAFPISGVVIGGAAVVLGAGAFGVGYGAFISALIGSSVDNPALEQFELAIEQGHILLIVDAETDNVVSIREVLDQLPGVSSVGLVEPLTAAF